MAFPQNIHQITPFISKEMSGYFYCNRKVAFLGCMVSKRLHF